MIRGAIFDVDGTLLDSMYVWQTIGDRYLGSLGIEPQEDLWDTFKTFTLEQSAQYYQQRYQIPQSVETIMDGVNRMIEEAYFQEVLPRPGIPALLERLQKAGIPMAIATATDR